MDDSYTIKILNKEIQNLKNSIIPLRGCAKKDQRDKEYNELIYQRITEIKEDIALIQDLKYYNAVNA